MGLEETRKLVGKAFRIHNKLSKIHNWTIKIERLDGLDEELRRKAEEFLNTMYKKGFYLSGGWLYYHYPKYYEEVEPRIIHETATILAKVLRKSGTTKVDDDKWIDSLLGIIIEELESKGIHVLSREFKLFVKYLLENVRQKKLLQRVVDYISKGKADHYTGIISLLPDYIGLTGKWMVFVPTSLYPRIFRYMVEALENTKLAYSAKITVRRNEYASRRELPVIVYVPISFVPRYVAEVAEVMKSVLDKFYVSKKMFFKPDLFTEKGVYSGRANHRSYIYVYQ